MSGNDKLGSTTRTDEYEDDFEDVEHVSKEPEATTAGRSAGGSIVADEIAAELAPAPQSGSRNKAPPARVLSPGAALMRAVINGRCKEVETLLGDGAPIRFTDAHGWTPLHWACSQGYPDVIETILHHERQKLNATGRDEEGDDELSSITTIQDHLTGWTPLHVACIQEHLAAVKLLLSTGADVNIADKQGDKPIDCVKNGESDAAKEIAQLLSDGDPAASQERK